MNREILVATLLDGRMATSRLTIAVPPSRATVTRDVTAHIAPLEVTDREYRLIHEERALAYSGLQFGSETLDPSPGFPTC